MSSIIPLLPVLLRRTKNNPVLIGDPGVGKTAVVEGIAQLIVSPAAPAGLRGRALIALDVGSLVAGTQYRGAFEERLTVGAEGASHAGVMSCHAKAVPRHAWPALRHNSMLLHATSHHAVVHLSSHALPCHTVPWPTMCRTLVS